MYLYPIFTRKVATPVSILDSIKKLFSSKQVKDQVTEQIGNVAQKLGFDATKVTGLFDQLLSKLDTLNADGKLDSMVNNAIAQFKPTLEQFKTSGDKGETAANDFADKAKGFLSSLSSANLPDEVKSLITTVKGLLGK